jgi:hypothetical protein
MKAIKYIPLFLVALLLTFVLVSCDDKEQGGEGSYSNGDYVYKLNDLGEASILRYKAKNTNVVIPSEIDGHKVTSIANCAFFNNALITDVTLPAGVTEIGKSAFEGCTSLKNVALPKSVELICEKAFYNCIKLENLIIEPGSALKEVEDNSFYACNNLRSTEYENAKYLPVGEALYDILLSAIDTSITEATIHADTRIINSKAFSKCSSITEITIPEKVEFIGNGAFYGCTKLDTIYFNAISAYDLAESDNIFERVGTTSAVMTLHVGTDVKRIPAYLMHGATMLRYIRFDENASCESIGKSAFYGTYIEEATLPHKLKTIEDYAFAECSYLEKITLNSERLSDLASDNKIFDSSGTGSGGITLVLGRESRRIPAYFCTSLSRMLYAVKFENNAVTRSFGKNAFLDCNSILRVDMTDRKEWCESDFENEYSNPLCYGNAILYVSSKEVTEGFALTDVIDFIADYAFIGYKYMEKIIIPETVTYIGTKAFYGVDKLNHIYWGGNELEWEDLEIKDGNTVLNTGTVYFHRPEALGAPTVTGNFWYLGTDGTPRIWRNIITN